MKYAFLVLFTVFFSSNVFARTITSFKDSESLTAIAQFMYDVAEDVPVSIRLTDKKINVTDLSLCAEVTADDVRSEVEKSIKKVLRFFPDDEVPFEQAIVDLEDYLDGRTYKKCTFENKASQSQTRTVYFTDVTNKIHLRLDNVALTAE